ncbi:GDP-L-fucose synthase [Prevotella sp. A2931]|uniref:GDP-L-fucose synthase n=1 Tax=Prevotella illustrans TaxID=2800387 RepID=A0ABS3M447_9BACT|nr:MULTISPECIES: GDP-L-fucose synthase [Prevotella]MBO1362885.1 GDP-L-fucose synthase [Prevotella illustrans]PTL27277.1 GDP-fucose synthetase [Prevotella sp. oral taxon 820]
MSKDSKIYIAGHHGLVGSAIWNNLKKRGFNNLVGCSHHELDLTDQQAVKAFFDKEKPDAVVLAAAFVGGIMANSLYRADFIMQNMKMQCNVIEQAYLHGVKKLLFLGSTCIYPKNAPQPMKEEALLTSPLEYTNEEYAIAKIAGLKMCESYNLQYGTNYIAVMPTNLYGPNDNFHLENSHVLPAMMRKIYLAKLIHDRNWEAIRKDMDKRPVNPTDKLRVIIGEGNVDGKNAEERILKCLAFYGIENNKVTLWGDGSPLRELLWSEDMADASVHVLLNVDFKDIIGIEKYSSVFYGAKTDGAVDRNNSEGRGGAIPSLGEIRNCHINVGTGKELTIKELAQLVVKSVGFEGKVCWDETKPNGTPRKLIDVSKLHSFGWTHKVEIEDGVERLYQWYRGTID